MTTPQGTADTNHRRKWNTTEYEIKAQERLAAEREEREDQEAKGRGEKPPKRFRPDQAPRVKREMLKPREYKVDLESKVYQLVLYASINSYSFR
jgi:U4/U6.U5 tri-snRNP component SNU23